jgi:hypothetical protein
VSDIRQWTVGTITGHIVKGAFGLQISELAAGANRIDGGIPRHVRVCEMLNGGTIPVWAIGEGHDSGI